MPWISDRDWHNMQRALVKEVHTRGEDTRSHMTTRFDELKKEIEMTRAEYREMQQKTLGEVKDLRGQVSSGFALLTKTIADIKTAAANADSMDEFKDDLATIEKETLGAQDDIKAAIAANPAPTDTQKGG